MPTAKSYSTHLGTDDWNPVKRLKPRLVVRRGYPGNETSALSRSLPPKAAESIRSGQIVTPDANGEWIVAGGAIAAGKAYIAYHDQADPDVISGNSLLAFDLNGDFELETGYFKEGNGTVADGVALVVANAGDKGNLSILSANNAGGTVVVGYLRGVKVDLSNGQYGTLDNMEQDTQASATNSVVVRFVTA